MCLALHVPSSNLTLSTCINRFLNLVSHTGFNLSGLTKYYDVAKKFRIPDWIVDVRHETTHGYLPSKQVGSLTALRESLFCLRAKRSQHYKSRTFENPKGFAFNFGKKMKDTVVARSLKSGQTKIIPTDAKKTLPLQIIKLASHFVFWQLLVDALVFCLGWIRNNYWDAEYDAMTRDEDVPGGLGSSVDADSSGMVDCATYTGLHNALDSYQYLKIYTIWGGEILCSTT